MESAGTSPYLPVLVPPTDAADAARSWATVTPGERLRRASEAAAALDLPTLADLSGSWNALYGRARSSSTAATYRQGIASLVAFCRRHGQNLLRPSADLGALWKARLEADGRATATVRAYLAGARQLAAALRWAGLANSEAFPPEVRPLPDRTADAEKGQVYTAAEVGKLHQATQLVSGRFPTQFLDRAAVVLGAHGLRIAEVLRLTWADIQLSEDRRNAVVRVTGKGRKVRTVYLGQSAVIALRGLVRDSTWPTSGHLFPSREKAGEPITPAALRARMRKLCARAAVTYRGFHALRHYCGRELYDRTGDLGAVAEHLGHSSIDTARVYSGRYRGLAEAVTGVDLVPRS